MLTQARKSLNVAGFSLKFCVARYMKFVAISPHSSPLATFCEEERLRLSDRNSTLMSDISQCLHIKNLIQSFGSKYKFVQFYISSGRFGKVLCSSANELQQNSNASSREEYIPQILTVLS